VFTPTKRTNITIDAYQIDVRNRIVQSTSLNQNLPGVGGILTAAGLDPNQSVSYFTNAGNTVTRGIDLVADHTQRLPDDWGSVKWVFTHSHLKHQIKQLNNPAVLTGANLTLVGRDIQSKLTTARPNDVTTLAANWQIGRFDWLFKATRYSHSLTKNAISAGRDEYVPPAFVYDTAFGWQVKDQVKFTLGANNVFNKRPPQLTDEAIRFYGFPVDRPNYSWAAPYGVNGAYYYARLDVSF
jgi:iron complex outermembrane receptor protein